MGTLCCKTLTELAGRLGEDRHALSAALSAPGAPEKRAKGFVVAEVGNFLFLRRLRKMTDADFDELCREVERGNTEAGELSAIADFRRGGRRAMIEELETQLAKPTSDELLDELETMILKMEPLSRVE